MRERYAVANWKMNTDLSEATILAGAVKKGAEDIDGLQIVICPPSIWLCPIADNYEHKPANLFLGAQNMYAKDKGTYTGEISPVMIKDICQYVILGHSERRYIFGEDDELVNEKVFAALSHGITPILCVGERERSEGSLNRGILNQLKASLANVKKEDIKKIIVAYEPVWAISTGDSASKQNASPEYVSGVIWMIREELKNLYGEDVAEGVSILYGGSVNQDNVDDYANLENVDGALVGAASLKTDNFLHVCRAFAK